ncbi:MAG: type II toxin-antitoxin system RelE/ParE family toxin [Flavobacteriales bacterium]|nr:type II toxin-antitoxin system RelE/ParE family toxin [Flavobacteriales bacterium]
MSLKLEWRDRAIHEAQDAFDWYEAQAPGTGERLITEIDAHVVDLLAHAQGYPMWRGPFKKINLKRFPYVIVFRIMKDAVIIYSVFHSKRNPSRWGERR